MNFFDRRVIDRRANIHRVFVKLFAESCNKRSVFSVFIDRNRRPVPFSVYRYCTHSILSIHSFVGDVEESGICGGVSAERGILPPVRPKKSKERLSG